MSIRWHNGAEIRCWSPTPTHQLDDSRWMSQNSRSSWTWSWSPRSIFSALENSPWNRFRSRIFSLLLNRIPRSPHREEFTLTKRSFASIVNRKIAQSRKVLDWDFAQISIIFLACWLRNDVRAHFRIAREKKFHTWRSWTWIKCLAFDRQFDFAFFSCVFWLKFKLRCNALNGKARGMSCWLLHHRFGWCLIGI